jgi:hypothetical protein
MAPRSIRVFCRTAREYAWYSRSCRRILIYAFDSLWIIENREGAMALSHDSLFSKIAELLHRVCYVLNRRIALVSLQLTRLFEQVEKMKTWPSDLALMLKVTSSLVLILITFFLNQMILYYL